MKKLKIGQIGALHDHSSAIFNSLKKQSDIFEIVGYAIPDEETITSEQVYSGYRQMSVEELLSFPDLDAVTIETSELNLTKYSLMAAERGLAIHMDKPGGIVLSDFEKLIETVKKNNTVFHTGYMYRYNSEVQKLIGEIRDGLYGEIYSVETHMDCMHVPSKRQWLGQFPGGMLFFLGCHLIDLIYMIMGEPESVIPLSCPTGIDGVSAEDYGMAILKYKNGISFAKTSAVEPGGFMRRQLVVTGSKGTAQLMPLEAYVPGSSNQYTGVRKVLTDIGNWNNDGEKYNSEPSDRYDGMMAAFASYVRGEKTNPFTPDYELRLYRLVLKSCGMEV